jgi:3-hydroxyacyl-CoA dehydrogenase
VTSNDSSVHVEHAAEIGIIVIDNPPVNALSQDVRAGLLSAIERLDRDASVRAIVIVGVGKHFIAGADIRELDGEPKAPHLPDVLVRLESSPKLVVAALHGTVLGGGAETALACRVRCGTKDIQIGFPEVKLGIIPGAGGTVRLPRLVGLRAALELMTKGEPIGYVQAADLGLVDHTVDDDAAAGAVAYARQLLAAGPLPLPVRDRPIRDVAAATAILQDFRASLAASPRRNTAAGYVVEAVESTISLPFADAALRARELFQRCRSSRESAALRHLFLAERNLYRPAVAPQPVERVGIAGAGTMGSGIAMSFAQAGIDVALFDANATALQAGLKRIQSMCDNSVKKGRLSVPAAESIRSRVQPVSNLAEAAHADLIIEAVVENGQVKQELFAQLGQLCRPGAVLATNTSTLDVDAIAAASGRPADVIGMHFFSPAHVMRLVEIVRGRVSSERALATAAAVARRIGKVGIVVGNRFGFVGNRMLHAYGREKEMMLLQGATPQQIDQALESFGMAMGPNAVGDLTGLDIGASVRREWKQHPDDPLYFRAADLLVEHGRLGQKSGRGFYRYDAPGKPRQVDAEAVELIRAEARRLNVTPREISDAEIVERSMLALINEGVRTIEESIARSAADIDVIWCNGYGFPRYRGGPMFYGDTLGLDHVLARTEHYAQEIGGRYWTPPALLTRLALERRGFTSLTAR